MTGLRRAIRWAPATVFGIGALFTVGVDTQQDMTLRAPLAQVVPAEPAGWLGADVVISPGELRAAGVDSYLMRSYTPRDTTGDLHPASLYVGYYERQTQGRTIHSPKNCLPGGGWEALESRSQEIRTSSGAVTVNRYLLKRSDQTALVLYWYQGRGRVEANEYVVKWDLLRDAAVRRRTEEALVRIVVPVRTDEAEALKTATTLAAAAIPALWDALPE